MPYTTLVAGTTITASWANTNVRDQVVSTFADSTARSSAITSPAEGMISYLTGHNRLDVYNATSWSSLINPSSGAWVDWSSSCYIQQSASIIASTINVARYIRIGRFVKARWHITVSGGGSAGQHVNVSLPFSHAHSTLSQPSGSAFIYDNSAAQGFGGDAICSTASALLMFFESRNSNAPDRRLGVVEFTAALAAGDLCGGSIEYEADADA